MYNQYKIIRLNIRLFHRNTVLLLTYLHHCGEFYVESLMRDHSTSCLLAMYLLPALYLCPPMDIPWEKTSLGCCQQKTYFLRIEAL